MESTCFDKKTGSVSRHIGLMVGKAIILSKIKSHVSKTRPKMPVADRAAQFSTFAALTGYEAAIKETARLTDERVELDEYMKSALSNKLQILAERIGEQPEIQITYFQPDEKKAGGAYFTVSGTVKKIDEYERIVVMTDGITIPIDEIINIDGEIFGVMWDK